MIERTPGGRPVPHASAPASRPIDHLVLAVPDLAAAVEASCRVGFRVGSRNRHPWGTENALIQLDGAYVELIGLAPDYRAPEPDDPAAPFADIVGAAVARGGGLAAVALGTDDADADAAAFRAAGLGTGRRLDFARGAVARDGTRGVLRFSLAFAEVPELPEAGFFTCRHHQPFGEAAARDHANGAGGLDAVVLVAEAPGRHVAVLASLFGREPEGPTERPRFATATGRLEVMSPADAAFRHGFEAAPGRFAVVRVAVETLAPVRAMLERPPTAFAEVDGAIVVEPWGACGVALAFVPAACHAGP